MKVCQINVANKTMAVTSKHELRTVILIFYLAEACIICTVKHQTKKKLRVLL
jgi:hypothetical protein